MGFSPCKGQSADSKSPGLFGAEVARLESCPDTKPDALGQPRKVHSRQDVFRQRVAPVEGFAGSLLALSSGLSSPAHVERRPPAAEQSPQSPRLIDLVQEQLLLEIIRRVLGRVKVVAAFTRKISQQSFFIFPRKSGDDDGTGRSQSIRWQRKPPKIGLSRLKPIIFWPN